MKQSQVYVIVWALNSYKFKFEEKFGELNPENVWEKPWK